MSPQDFIQKAEVGTLTDEEIKEFMGSISGKLSELKEKDPAAYLKALRALNDATEAIAEGLEAVGAR